MSLVRVSAGIVLVIVLPLLVGMIARVMWAALPVAVVTVVCSSWVLFPCEVGSRFGTVSMWISRSKMLWSSHGANMGAAHLLDAMENAAYAWRV
eukprot:8339568-Pyramimonas_sp.AAC.1